MLKYIFIILVLIYTIVQADIITISEPVETEFGLYTPELVTVRPAAIPCDIGKNLEHVVNLDQFNLTNDELSCLKKNHFFVKPAIRPNSRTNPEGYNELFDIYCQARENNTPIFVTTDALYHTFHLCFDIILTKCEVNRFISDLDAILSALISETRVQQKVAIHERVAQALNHNLQYLIVAKKCLDSTWSAPVTDNLIQQELRLINQAEQSAISPLFGYEEDYTQYIVRGHYTKSDSLREYFKSMMWLGRMTFACVHPDDPKSVEHTRSALLLLQAIQNIRINERAAINVWDDIYQSTVFFVGKSDDINFHQYHNLAKQVYGDTYIEKTPDQFANHDTLQLFLEKTKDLEGPAIGYPGQPAKGFRFMGQRFIPDSWILDELVFNKIPNRYMPTGLDVMYVLGSDRAFEYIDKNDKNNPYYTTKLDSLRLIFSGYKAKTWAQNAYWNWLYSLVPLLQSKGNGYPLFMQNSAWLDKDLHAALASWAELRHDTILYAKQSGTERAMPDPALGNQGYVEPNAEAFARLAALAAFMKTGLSNRNLLYPSFDVTLNKLINLLGNLKNIAEKELTNTALTSDDYKTIFNIGQTLFDITTFGKKTNGPNPESAGSDTEPMPVIADVHTDANSGLVLEEGVGYPYAIYVICNVEGQAVLAKGAAFSYYEFTWPKSDRLSDQQWRNLLNTQPPSPPEWTKSFLLDKENPINSDFYLWNKPGSLLFDVDISPGNIKKGDHVTLRITLNSSKAKAPCVNIDPKNKDPFSVTLEQISEGQIQIWETTIPTMGLDGKTYINIKTNLFDEEMRYRTHFFVETATSVSLTNNQTPMTFSLDQNSPNPFNSSTLLKFRLAKTQTVVLDIFDVTGRKVKTLISAQLPPGIHRVRWDGTDENGVSRSSGIYFYRIYTENHIQVKRMLLVK